MCARFFAILWVYESILAGKILFYFVFMNIFTLYRMEAECVMHMHYILGHDHNHKYGDMEQFFGTYKLYEAV